MRALRAILAGLAAFLLTAGGYDEYAASCDAVRPEIERVLTEEGVGTRYYWLAVAESHCDAGAVSRKGAVGIWQMLPATAKAYGCDAPHDIVCQTHAAARYLAHLEKKCGPEHVIHCWHDGGSNFLRRGYPTRGARGLDWQFRKLAREHGHE